MGRPAIYTDELAETFCQRIAEGRSERSVCKDDDMPSHTTIQKWERESPAFAAQYTRARDERAAFLAEEALSISDALGTNPSSEQVQAARLQVDTRKWFASKLAPKRFGERIQTDSNINVSGGLTLAAIPEDELDRVIGLATIGTVQPGGGKGGEGAPPRKE